MTQYKRVAIDTSKAVFTLHCIDQSDRTVLRTDLRRAQLLALLRKLPPRKSPWKPVVAAIIGAGN